MPSTGHTCMYTQTDGKPENNGSSPIYRMGRRIKVNTTECQHSRTSRLFKVKLLRAHKEHAIDRTRWRKLIKDVRWSEWVWVGECFFWYWPTQVVPDKGPLKKRLCECSEHRMLPRLCPRLTDSCTCTRTWEAPGHRTECQWDCCIAPSPVTMSEPFRQSQTCHWRPQCEHDNHSPMTWRRRPHNLRSPLPPPWFLHTHRNWELIFSEVSITLQYRVGQKKLCIF